jgi:retron-type reverse transcriptase
VKTLQWLLTHSFSGRALAVKRVTENKGKRTPGVDGRTWQTPAAKFKSIGITLRRRGYQPQPLRRVHIPKANGKLRPLGIPTMKDRAMQALYLLALGTRRGNDRRSQLLRFSSWPQHGRCHRAVPPVPVPGKLGEVGFGGRH